MNQTSEEKRIIRSCPGPEGKDQRLDCWLAGRFTYRSRSEWQKAVRNGEILLNGGRTRPSRILHGDETIDFQVPDQPEPPVRTDFRILAEYPRYIAVEKPGNLPVHPSGCFFNHTLLMLLRKQYGELYPVNRLDRETSGIILFAKDPAAAGILGTALAVRSVRKKYIVYVHGRFPDGTLDASGWLSNDPVSPIRKKRRFTWQQPDCPDAEECRTEFVLMNNLEGFSKVECILHTGRLHQIRATLFSLGFPVVGDKLYGLDDGIFDRFADGRMTDNDKKTLIIERQALHAYEIKMTDPFDGEEKVLNSPVPSELTSLESP
jgi:RluA family pseudouridine synthase